MYCSIWAAADSPFLNVVFYPHRRLIVQCYKKFISGPPADSSQRVKNLRSPEWCTIYEIHNTTRQKLTPKYITDILIRVRFIYFPPNIWTHRTSAKENGLVRFWLVDPPAPEEDVRSWRGITTELFIATFGGTKVESMPKMLEINRWPAADPMLPGVRGPSGNKTNSLWIQCRQNQSLEVRQNPWNQIMGKYFVHQSLLRRNIITAFCILFLQNKQHAGKRPQRCDKY